MKATTISTGGRLWVRLIRGHRAARDLIVPCSADNPLPALREAMHELDLSMPVWLPRHQADWEAFRLTRFTQEHFLDSVNFDRMEISYIAPEEERKPPRFTE
ncbi:MAG: hypothetical protein LLF96_01060 [Eubacteriales bacterium]|nr:hypothetical protein [Eubacteriales bacterium]